MGRINTKHRGTLEITRILSIVPALVLAACNNGETRRLESGLTVLPEGQTSVSEQNPAPTPAPVPTPTGSPIPPADQLYSGPAEVAPYVTKFVQDAQIQGVDVLPDMKNPTLTIQIASLDSYGASTIGLCETSGNQRRVTFDPDFWNTASDTQRELVAFHELSHCVLYRAHRSDLTSTGTYASIMYPSIMTTSMYQNNYEYYQNELFTWNATNRAGIDARTDATHICGLESEI